MIASHPREILSVSQLNATARLLLETNFSVIWVEGELSNLSKPGSGHLYFTLKDGSAQIRAAMFRARNQLLRFMPISGLQVLVRARVSLYEPRGDYQLIVEHMEEAGEGALRRAFDALRFKLAEEGLFNTDRKQTLPEIPRCIGVITSPTGAALRDVISVLRRRFPALPVVVYPAVVQGQDAVPSITAALTRANRDRRCDVLIVTRGGGSLEDLWAFNEEPVARAIAASHIPVISAVGHETDITIADFAADVRAPTPSVAAELVSPNRHELGKRLQHDLNRIHAAVIKQVTVSHNQIKWLSARLFQRHPSSRLQQQGQRLDELELRLHRAFQHHLQQIKSTLIAYHRRLASQVPTKNLAIQRMAVSQLRKRLDAALIQQTSQAHQRLSGLARTLEAISPLATLSRGYAILIDEQGRAIRDAHQVQPGDEFNALLARGRLRCEVMRCETADAES